MMAAFILQSKAKKPSFITKAEYMKHQKQTNLDISAPKPCTGHT